MHSYLIIDFDSTLSQVEGLDELAEIALAEAPDGAERLAAIRALTHKGMEGLLSFEASLQERIRLLRAHQRHLPLLIERLRQKISPSFLRNQDFLRTYQKQIFIVSSGFKEFVVPIVTGLGLLEAQVYANTFCYDASGNITGYDRHNLLAKNKGKVALLKSLDLKGDIYVLGDGYTDYEMREAGLANRFYAFTENIQRENVMSKADYIIPALEEFLYIHQLPMKVSYPKNRIRVLLLENIHQQAAKIFQEEGYQVEWLQGGLDEEELCERIKDVSVLGIRSKTELTPKVLAQANKLIAVGAFCIGTNQIALKECMQKGVAVFNAPYSNTRSVVELAIGQMIMLIRGIVEKNRQMHEGIWDKSAKNSFEIRGKKLGIVGYGNIGTQLSVLAEAMGMQVYFYDVVDKLALGNATKCQSLEELLGIADIVSLHVDGRKDNSNLIGTQELALMKPGAILLNLSRGFVVEIEALVAHLQSGHLAGASVDVFPYEPKTNQEPFESALRNLPNVILTPHIGGSTQEAQENIANFVPQKIIEYINTGSTYGSVNLPNLQLPAQKEAHRLLHIHKNTAGILANINRILAEHEINILGQYLKTNEEIGYVITDIDRAYDKELIAVLKSTPHTIRFRVLY